MDPEWITMFEEKIEELGRDETWAIVEDNTIAVNNLAPGWQQYICSTYGGFKCSKCKNMWPSKKVTVLFHMHLNTRNDRGTVKVCCYRQECRRCTDPTLEEPWLRKENVDCLLEKLIEKIRIKCYREDFSEMGKQFSSDGRVEGPHEPSHCKACLEEFGCQGI